MGCPFLGVCLGSQLLATALGAQVRKGSRKEIGWHRVFLESAAVGDPLPGAAPHEFNTFHWHGDTFDLPPGAAWLAHSTLTECQSFRHARNVYGILFHMEVTRSMIYCMMDAFASELLEEGIDPGELKRQTESHWADVQQIGEGVFRAWAQIVASH